MTPVILACFAHPDDETFLAGPLLAKYAAAGVQVHLLCATPPDPESTCLEFLRAHWQLRRESLLCASRALGAQDVRFLGFDGAGMRNPADDGLAPQLTGVEPSEAADGVVAVIDELKPDVVLVDSPYGAYGHPDHIAMHRAAVTAFDRVAARGSRLYALAFPLPLIRLNLLLMKAGRVPLRRLGARGDIDLVDAVRLAPKKSALIDVGPYVSARREAGRCYEAEIANAPLPLKLLERGPFWIQKTVFRRIALTRLRPPAEGFERVLFTTR